MIYTHAAAAIAGAALAFAGAWQVQGWRMSAQLSQLKTEYATAQVRAVEKAHAETIRLQDRKDAAERVARQRQSALAADVAGARDALVGLSHAAEGALLAAQSSHSSCIAKADAFADVFGQCRGRLQEVGEAADGHASDAQTLIDSWPK
jgi:hypothetical protein